MKNTTTRFEENPYYSPEKCGLEMFAVEDAAGSYEFDAFVVWRLLSNGNVYTAHDSGCSCPTPFEEFRTLDSLTYHPTQESLENAIKSWANEYGNDGRRVACGKALLEKCDRLIRKRAASK